MKTNYEVVIVGGGPAGLSAGIYAARARLNTLLIERALFGGQMCNAELIENYPGFPDGISGYELGQHMEKQAHKFGLTTITAEVTAVDFSQETKLGKTTEGDFTAKAVILAMGSERSKVGVPGEAEFTGKGVSYCATCDAAFFADRNVAVLGGGNSAINEALQLTNFATKVIIIHRRHELRATRILQEKALAEPKIEFLWDTVVEEIQGDTTVKQLNLKNVVTGKKSTLEVAGVFVAIGQQPSTSFLAGVLALDEYGYFVTNDKMETTVPGVFAAGDIRQTSIRQSITAAGDGATAAVYAERFLRH